MIVPQIVGYALFARDLSPIVMKDGTTRERKTPLFAMMGWAGDWCFEVLKNKKKELKINFIASDQNPYRKHDATSPAYYVQCRPAGCPTYNLTGLRAAQMTETDTYTYSGEPYAAPVLKSGAPNPLYRCRNDGFIFQFDKDYSRLEWWILSGQKEIIDSYRNAFALGVYDPALDAIRKTMTRC